MTFDQGDIIIMDFDPQLGHEQKGRRPALVLSNNTLNRHSSLIMVCPITSRKKKHPFHVALDSRTKTTGVILCDHVKMLDVSARDARFLEKCPSEILDNVNQIVIDFL